jgi:hypothetical protein
VHDLCGKKPTKGFNWLSNFYFNNVVCSFSDWEAVVDLKSCINAPPSQLTKNCGDILPVEITNSETSSYSDVLLNWVMHWNPKTRSRIIADQVLYHQEMNGVLEK